MSHPVKVDRGDGVVSTVIREVRVRHRTDTVESADDMFGGDDMGHWNVGRIRRILEACGARTIKMRFSQEDMEGMGAAGTPNPAKALAFSKLPLETMPPLLFIEAEPGALMLVDGHHRAAALALRGERVAPSQCLPHALCDDVRIVELSEVAIMPDLWKEPHRSSAQRAA